MIGAQTRAAIRADQKDRGLTVEGQSSRELEQLRPQPALAERLSRPVRNVYSAALDRRRRRIFFNHTGGDGAGKEADPT